MAGKKQRRRPGYSLIELIISTFAVGLLLSSVAIALVYCNQYLRTCETKAQAQEQALTTVVWMSRFLQDANVTAMTASGVNGVAAPGISFASVRDASTTAVTFATTAGGAIEWPQNIVVYLAPDPMDTTANVIIAKSFVNGPPTPYDPPTLGNGLLDLATASTTGGIYQRVLAHNIRSLAIEIYSPTITTDSWPSPAPDPPVAPNTVNITVCAFAPYYSLNYGVNVSTSIRPQN